MRRFISFLNSLLVPALVGCVAALTLLLWLPHKLPSALITPGHPDTQGETQPAPVIPAAGGSVGPVSYADAVEVAAPAVVNIYTRTLVRRQRHPIFDDPLFQRFFGNNPQPDERIQSSLGSGVIMSADGFVLTNNHVINGADEIVVALRDGREAAARVVGTDPESDLALLQIQLTDLPVIGLAEGPLRIGDVVLAIGNPFGVGQTVTLGIVSATGRNQLGLNTYEDYIQTDAAINPGNSGGALINAHGDLVGINTAIFSKSGGSQGIGFAIPATIAHRTLQDIAQHGSPIRGWLGIEVQESTPALLNSLGLPQALTGLIVTGIYPDGPADNAGLNIGDIIVKINQQTADNARRAMNQIAAVRPGETVAIEFLHAGQLQQANAIAGQRKVVKQDN